MTLWERLENEMVDRDLTLTDMIKEMNTSHRSIVMIRNGERPSTKIYRKVCKFLNEDMSTVRQYKVDE